MKKFRQKNLEKLEKLRKKQKKLDENLDEFCEMKQSKVAIMQP